MKPKYWTGSPPDEDDFGQKISDVFYDAKSKLGPWGFMNPETFKFYGVGVGSGRGQRYEKQLDGKWLKTEG